MTTLFDVIKFLCVWTAVIGIIKRESRAQNLFKNAFENSFFQIETLQNEPWIFQNLASE